MNWNIFSGLDTKAAVSQAKLKVQQLQEQHKDMNEQVQLDVQTAYLKIKETVDRIRTTETAVTQGEENLRLNEERYKESVGTATDVIDAETLLTRTRVVPGPQCTTIRWPSPRCCGPSAASMNSLPRRTSPAMSRKLLARIGIGLLVLLLIGGQDMPTGGTSTFSSVPTTPMWPVMWGLFRPGCRVGWPKSWWTTTSTLLPARSC